MDRQRLMPVRCVDCSYHEHIMRANEKRTRSRTDCAMYGNDLIYPEIPRGLHFPDLDKLIEPLDWWSPTSEANSHFARLFPRDGRLIDCSAMETSNSPMKWAQAIYVKYDWLKNAALPSLLRDLSPGDQSIRSCSWNLIPPWRHPESKCAPV